MTRRIITILIALIIIAAAAYFYASSTGGAVILPTADAPDSVRLPMGKTGRINDLSITFNAMTQDSRCPAGVMCIQAGSVTPNVTLSSGGKEETLNLPQDEVPHEFAGYQIFITGTEPLRRQQGDIAQSEYIVTFSVLPFTRVTYACDGGRSIVATYAGEQVHLDLDDTLGNDRQFYIPRVMSADGARYSNGDDTFVFWNKGKTAFVTEQDGDTTFANCIEKE